MNNSYKKAMDKIELSDELKEKIIKTALAQSKSISPQNNYKYVKRLTGIAACFIICLLSVYTVTDHAIIQPIEIVSEKSSETTPTPNTDRTSEKNVVKNNPVQETAKNTPLEKKPSTEKIPDTKTVVSPDNTNKPISDSTDNDEKLKIYNTDNETVKPKQEIETAKKPSVANNSLPPYVTGKKVVSENNNISNTKTDIKQLTAELGYEIKSPQNLPEEYNTTKISVVDKNIAEITYQSETDTITYRTAKSSGDISGDDNSYTDIEKVQINNFNVTLKGNKNLYHNACWTDNDEAFSVTSITGIEKNEMIDVIESVGYDKQGNVNEEEQ